MNAIQAKQLAIKEFKNYLKVHPYFKGTLYVAVSQQKDAIITKTENGALQLGLAYTFEINIRYKEGPITAIICNY